MEHYHLLFMHFFNLEFSLFNFWFSLRSLRFCGESCFPHAVAPWHFLYFLPLPHGHGSLRPTAGVLRTTGMRRAGPSPSDWPPRLVTSWG
jgi:hypothetical protein